MGAALPSCSGVDDVALADERRRNDLNTRSQRAGGLMNGAHILMSAAPPPNGRRAGLQWKPRSFEWALIGCPMEETPCDRRQSIRSQRAGGLINGAHILMSSAWPPDGRRAGL